MLQVPFGCQPATGKMGGDLACVRGLPMGWGCTHRSSGALQGSCHFPPNIFSSPQFVGANPAFRRVHALHPSHSG